MVYPTNPRVFTVPAYVKRTVAGPVYRRNEVKGMDMIPMLKYPDQAAARYAPEERDPRKNKGVRGALFKCVCADQFSFTLQKPCTICADTQEEHLVRCFQCKKYYHRYCLEPMALGVAQRWMCPDHDNHLQFNAKQYRQEQEEHDDDGAIYEPEAIRLDFQEKSLPSFCRPDDSSSSESEEARPRASQARLDAPTPQRKEKDMPAMTERERRRRERENAPKQARRPVASPQPEVSDEARQASLWVDHVNLDMNQLLERQYDQLIDFAKEFASDERVAKLQTYMVANENFWQRHMGEPIPAPPLAKYPIVERDPSPLADFVFSALNGPRGDRNPYYQTLEPTSQRDISSSVDFSVVATAPMQSMMQYLNDNPQLKDYLALQRLSQLAHQVNVDLGFSQLGPLAQEAIRTRPPHTVIVKSSRAFAAAQHVAQLQTEKQQQEQEKLLLEKQRQHEALLAAGVVSSPQKSPVINSGAPSKFMNKLLPVSPVTIVARTQVKRSAPKAESESPLAEPPSKRLKTSPIEEPPKPQVKAETNSNARPIPVSSATSPSESLIRRATRSTPATPATPQSAPVTPVIMSLLRTPETPAAAKDSAPPASKLVQVIDDDMDVDDVQIIATKPVVAAAGAASDSTPVVWPAPAPADPAIPRRVETGLRKHHWKNVRPKQWLAPETTTDANHPKPRYLHYDRNGHQILAVLMWEGSDKTVYRLALREDGAAAEPSVRFGRANEIADIDLADFTEVRTASHEHAELYFDRERHCLVLENFGRNGTRVNGALYGKYANEAPLDQQTTFIDINDGDIFSISHLNFTVTALYSHVPQPNKNAELAHYRAKPKHSLK